LTFTGVRRVDLPAHHKRRINVDLLFNDIPNLPMTVTHGQRLW